MTWAKLLFTLILQYFWWTITTTTTHQQMSSLEAWIGGVQFSAEYSVTESTKVSIPSERDEPCLDHKCAMGMRCGNGYHKMYNFITIQCLNLNYVSAPPEIRRGWNKNIGIMYKLYFHSFNHSISIPFIDAIFTIIIFALWYHGITHISEYLQFEALNVIRFEGGDPHMNCIMWRIEKCRLDADGMRDKCHMSTVVEFNLSISPIFSWFCVFALVDGTMEQTDPMMSYHSLCLRYMVKMTHFQVQPSELIPTFQDQEFARDVSPPWFMLHFSADCIPGISITITHSTRDENTRVPFNIRAMTKPRKDKDP